MDRIKYLSFISQFFLKHFLFFIIIIGILYSLLPLNAQALTTTGLLPADETWTDSVIITGDVTVPSGITLTIGPGTTVQFLPDEGLELIVEGTLQAEGTQSQPITFTSQAGDPLPGDWTWIYFSEGSQGQLDHCRIFHANTGIRVKMCSPVITNNRLETNLFGLNLSRSNARISQSIIKQNGIGITADYCQAQITHNHICQNTYEGIVLGHASSDTLLQNNLIYDNGRYGLILEYSSMAPIVNNTVFRNQQDGILLKKESITKVCNNIISHNQGFGISCWQSSWPVIFYNDLWSNTGRNYYDYATGGGYAPLPGVGEISEDPLYMDETLPDLHLRAESVAIDAGNPASPYDQEPLPNGERINMGAYGNTQEAALSCETQCTIRIAQNILGTTGASIVIPVSIETAQSVTGIENLVIRYVSTILEPTDISVTGLGQGLNLASNLTTPGEIRISAFDTGQAPIQGTGYLFEVTFNITGSPGSTTPLDLISVKRVLGEEDTPVCTQLEDGDFTILGEVSISGTITYYNDSSPVPGVNIALSGSGTYETTSTQTGQYVLTGIPDGLDYTLTPIKEADTRGSIGIYDAILIARQTVGLESFGTYQSMAADVNGNNESDIGDAIKIARYTVGLESLPFAPGRVWEFIPDQIAYTPLVGNRESQDFMSLIYGDVDGDWAQRTMRMRRKSLRERTLSEPGESSTCLFSLPGDLAANHGDLMDAPLNINCPVPILGFSNLFISYNPDVLEAQSVNSTSFSQGLTIVGNLNNPGEIRLSAFGATTLSGEGTLASISFNITGTSGDSSLIELISIADIVSETGESLDSVFEDGRFSVYTNLSMPQNVKGSKGEIIQVPISITMVNQLFGIENLIINYSPVVLEAQAVEKTSLIEDLTLISNLNNPGEIRLSLFGVTPFSGEGEIINITFKAIGSNGDSSTLDLSSLNRMAGEENSIIPVNLIDGSFIITDTNIFSEEISLHAGWNSVGIAVDINGIQASELCQIINNYEQGNICAEIDRFYSGGWEAHVCGKPFNNFDILPGEGYFLKCSGDGHWSQIGYEIPSPLEITLSAGWNAISIPSWAEGRFYAQDLIDLINVQAQDQCCTEINRLYAGSWEGHIHNLPFNNFQVVPGEMYLIKMTKEMTLILEK